MGAEATIMMISMITMIMMISMITMNSPGSPSMQRQLFAVSNGCQVIIVMMVMMMVMMMIMTIIMRGFPMAARWEKS